jgi:hypothetical protein
MPRPTSIQLPLSLAVATALAACGFTTGTFPSLLPRPEETPREIAVLDAGTATLSDEEAARLKADLRQEQATFELVRSALATADRTLTTALGRARGSAWGSQSWSDAQVALSRFQEERFPLSALRLRLDAVRLMVDPLAETDPSRIAVENLAAEVVALDDRSIATAEAAARSLER